MLINYYSKACNGKLNKPVCCNEHLHKFLGFWFNCILIFFYRTVAPKVDRPGEIEKPEVKTNNSIQLTCPASGVPLPEITWYKNNKPISLNSTEYNLLNNGWTIEIMSAKVGDTARCVHFTILHSFPYKTSKNWSVSVKSILICCNGVA